MDSPLSCFKTPQTEFIRAIFISCSILTSLNLKKYQCTSKHASCLFRVDNQLTHSAVC